MAPILGTRSRVSEVLNGNRPLTFTMIRRLHSRLGLPAELLIGERAAAAYAWFPGAANLPLDSRRDLDYIPIN